MDGASLLNYAVLALIGALTLTYAAVVILTPAPPVEHPSERRYRSARYVKETAPLPSIKDEPTLDLTVVIPAYNETERLPSMLDTTLAHVAAHPERKTELLIVDDGSRDGTAEFALKLAKEHSKRADIRVVQLVKNRGKGGAVRHGMMHGRGKRLLMVDADGASRFEDLELLWKAMDKLGDGPAVTIGSRAHLVKTEAVVKRSFLRNLLMYGLHTILRIVGVGHIRDTQCGFKLFSRQAAATLFPAQRLQTWIFDVELLLRAKQAHIPVAEVPIEWHEVPGSKLNVFLDSLQMLRDLLVLRANQLLRRW